MPKYVFAYHGGGKPDTPEEGAKAMEAWNNWFGSIGAGVVDGGAPVGMSSTVSASGVEDNGGSNPISGYSVLEAADMAAAQELAKGCPILDGGKGTVEIAEVLEM